MACRLTSSGWQKRLPNNAPPANPKTSGSARWNFVALWGSVTQAGGSEDQAKDSITRVYKNAEVLPKDAREATDTFIRVMCC